MKIAAIFCLLFATALYASDDYVLGPDSTPQAGVPKGTLTRYKLEPGRFFPGTPHDYSVYVPAGNDPSKPAPFMIFMDGSAFMSDEVRVPVVLDNLIARHELPPLIAIFINPGVLPAVADTAQNRFERVFEYDSLNDRYAEFLL